MKTLRPVGFIGAFLFNMRKKKEIELKLKDCKINLDNHIKCFEQSKGTSNVHKKQLSEFIKETQIEVSLLEWVLNKNNLNF